MAELRQAEKSMSKAMPAIVHMDPKKKRKIIQAFADQERRWEILKPSEIKIDKAEVGLWKSFMSTAKKDDFVKVPTLEKLENGEIARLTVDGFESFEVVKIRAKEKDIYAMVVVNAVIRDPAGNE